MGVVERASYLAGQAVGAVKNSTSIPGYLQAKYQEGYSEGQANSEALDKTKARWARAEAEQRAKYDREHSRVRCEYCGTGNSTDRTRCSSCGAPLKIPERKSTTSQQQAARKSVQEVKKAPVRRPKIKYIRPQPPVSPVDFGQINMNIARGSHNTTQGVHRVNQGVSVYHDTMIDFNMNFGANLDNIDHNMAEYEKRIRRMFG